MRTYKPSQASIATRVVEYRKKIGLSFSAMLCSPFEQSSGINLWSEQSLWKTLASEPEPPILDEGVTKSCAEYLVHGYAFSTQERPNACAVRARFANNEKTILAFGRRYWLNGQPSEPEPFKKLAINWSNAFGGTTHALNPAGKGIAVVDGIQWLPQLEMPLDRLTKPQQIVQSAGFSSRDITHPQRMAMSGTYDSDYLKLHSPGFPPDIDWRYFNAAPHDQWITNGLVGDEAFAFDNMHPTEPLVQGKLPSVRARLFVNYADPNHLVEVPLRLTTVWFLPHLKISVQIFQGLTECARDDGSDIGAAVIGIESLAQPKSIDHYAGVIKKRGDPVLGSVHSLNDADLLPDNSNLHDPIALKAQEAFKVEGFRIDAQIARAQIEAQLAKERAIAQGMDPKAFAVAIPKREKPPTTAELPTYIEKQNAAIQAQQLEDLNAIIDSAQKALLFQKEHGIKLANLQHRGPPKFSAQKEIEELEQCGYTFSTKMPKEKVLGLLQKKELVERLGYLQCAHQQPPAKPLMRSEQSDLRKQMQVAIDKNLRFFSGSDFTGADFSNLDLRGFNFEGCWLESVNFSRSNMSGATFTNSVLAHCDLTQTVAIKCDLKGANLGGAKISGLIADQSNFSGAIFDNCKFENTSMQAARFTGASFNDVKWTSCDWQFAELQDVIFHKHDLQAVLLNDAQLQGASFLECNLQKVKLNGANVSHATFYKCNLQEASLKKVTAKKTLFVEATTLCSANLEGADCSEANFGTSDFSSACLRQANLDYCNATGIVFNQADLRLASAKSMLGRWASFKNAKVAGVNFQMAILQNADFRGADMRRAHFFGADLSRIVLDGHSQLDQSVFTRSRTFPRLSAEQQSAMS